MRLWWRRLWCDHAWRLLGVEVRVDPLFDLGWSATLEECGRCGKVRRSWAPL